MGQPIHLQREGETLTVYGPNQAKVMIAQGWRPADEKAVIETRGADDLTAIKGVGAALAAVLADAGLRSYAAIANATEDKLVALDKINARKAKDIKEAAGKLAAEM